MANIVITIPHGNEEKKYTLEFTRRTIIKMEEEKVIEKLSKAPTQETIDALVKYGCYKNHPNITNEEVVEIVDSVPLDKMKDFVEAVVSLLEKTINALQTDKQGNAHWEVH